MGLSQDRDITFEIQAPELDRTQSSSVLTTVPVGVTGIEGIEDDRLLFRTAGAGAASSAPSAADRDQLDLARAGKKQVLRRNFGLTSMVGFSCALMCTWEGLLTGFTLGFNNGGPAGLIYGLFVTWLGTLSVFSVLGEMSSMVPTASGQYHWVNILAPPTWKRFLSYMTGWLTMTGWVAALAATAFFVASLITALIQLNDPLFSFQPWQQTLIFWAILGINIFINTATSKALPIIEVIILILHVLGFFAILIPLIYLSPQKSAHEVFTTFTNNGGWPTQALSFFVGLQGNANAFTGADGAVHMSEEVKNASRNVARSIVYSIIINGCLSLGILLAVLFSADPNSVPPNVLYPFIPILANALGSNAGATVLAAIVMVLQMCASIACLASSSRMIWAFARDRGLPGWTLWSRVNKHTTLPLYAIGLAVAVAALVGFINLGSNTAFNDVISLTLEGLFTSYLLPCGLLLYHRIKGHIGEPEEEDDLGADGVAVTYGRQKLLTWGPWRLRGWFGIANNAIACCYLLVISFFSFWPTETPVAAKDMNYSVVVWGAVIILSLTYYSVWARKTYIGSIVEVEVPPRTLK